MPQRVLDLRAWRLALAGPSVYWYFPVFFVLLSMGSTAAPLGLFLLVVALVVSACWGFLINDYFDRQSDAKSGKTDSIHGHGLSRTMIFTLILGLAVVTWVIIFAVGGGFVFKGVLALNYVIAFFYSAPPVRFKIRKFWGFFANSLIERPLPILVLFAFMNYFTLWTVALPILMELTWSVFKHQAADLRGDVEAGVATFAVSLGEERSNKIVQYVLNPVSVICVTALAVIAYASIPELHLPLEIVFVLVPIGALLTYAAERRGKIRIYYTPTDPPYVIFLNLAYRYLLLPVMAIGIAIYLPQYFLLVVFLTVSLLFQTYLYSTLLTSKGGPTR